jgi:hypothetical protein
MSYFVTANMRHAVGKTFGRPGWQENIEMALEEVR